LTETDGTVPSTTETTHSLKEATTLSSLLKGLKVVLGKIGHILPNLMRATFTWNAPTGVFATAIVVSVNVSLGTLVKLAEGRYAHPPPLKIAVATELAKPFQK